MIFLDTSAIYAMADVDDLYHNRARELFEKALEEGETLILHNYIVVEACALLLSRLGLDPAQRFLREVEAFQMHWVDPDTHRKAAEQFDQRGKSGLSFVDLVSFLVMRENNISRFIGFDEDFEREGFILYK